MWSLAQPLGELKGNRQRKFSKRDARRLLDGKLSESNIIFCEQDCLDSRLQRELNCSIHA